MMVATWRQGTDGQWMVLVSRRGVGLRAKQEAKRGVGRGDALSTKNLIYCYTDATNTRKIRADHLLLFEPTPSPALPPPASIMSTLAPRAVRTTRTLASLRKAGPSVLPIALARASIAPLSTRNLSCTTHRCAAPVKPSKPEPSVPEGPLRDEKISDASEYVRLVDPKSGSLAGPFHTRTILAKLDRTKFFLQQVAPPQPDRATIQYNPQAAGAVDVSALVQFPICKLIDKKDEFDKQRAIKRRTSSSAAAAGNVSKEVQLTCLEPLDGGGGLGRDVENHAIDALHLVGDAVRHLAQELGREGEPGGRHKSRGADLLNVDAVGVLEDLDLLARHDAQDADRQSRAGERMPAHQMRRNAQQTPKRTHLVLEQLAQRLDQLELHVLQQTTDVVVRLDRRRRTLERDALDHVRIQRALEEVLELALGLLRLACRERRRLLVLGLLLQLGHLGLKHVDEGVADDLALLLRVLDVLELGEELLRGVDDGEVDAEVLGEHLVHLRGLVGAQHAVVHHDGVEAVADGLVHELGGDGRVDTSRNGAEHLALGADDLADALDLLVDERLHGPVAAAVADVDKVVKQLDAAHAVRHLGVELDAVDGLGLVGHGGEGCGGRLADDDKVLGRLAELVAVRHPDLHAALPVLEERVEVGHAGLDHLDLGVAVLALVVRVHLAAVVPGDLLEAVADAEHGHAGGEDVRVDARRHLVVHRVGRAGEDDALGLPVEVLDLLRAGEHLAVHVELTASSRDQMRVLRSKVEDEDRVILRVDGLGHVERRGCLSEASCLGPGAGGYGGRCPRREETSSGGGLGEAFDPSQSLKAALSAMAATKKKKLREKGSPTCTTAASSQKKAWSFFLLRATCLCLPLAWCRMQLKFCSAAFGVRRTSRKKRRLEILSVLNRYR
ncbi:hypothetical protein L1887_55164 [Cichorium endivia]|nr:hypothetical protein L1887_55164 [Cichorium endivia]